jgi:hypothetical protein
MESSVVPLLGLSFAGVVIGQPMPRDRVPEWSETRAATRSAIALVIPLGDDPPRKRALFTHEFTLLEQRKISF